MGSELCEGFWVEIGVHQGYVWSPLRFAIAVNVITENVREKLMNGILCGDDLVLLSKIQRILRRSF